MLWKITSFNDYISGRTYCPTVRESVLEFLILWRTWRCVTFLKGPPNTFFLENALKKLLNIFSKFFFYLKVQFFRLLMENNFLQIAVLAGHAVAYTTGAIIDCEQLYFTNGFTKLSFKASIVSGLRA